jgi:hypothetical protein
MNAIANSTLGLGPTHQDSFYVPKSIKPKRLRRTKAEVAAVRTAILDILSKDNPQTVRQVFYALTVRGVFAKAEAEYHGTVIRLLGEMREAGTIPFAWIADNTRWQRKPSTFTGYAPSAEIHFERPAVTREQVEQWNLPTRPTKQTDTRAKKFANATSVELDAIPAAKLRELVRECIERHVDREKLALLRVAEESERELLVKWAATYGGTAVAS